MDSHVEITTHLLRADEGLTLDPEEKHTLVVRSGVVYVSLQTGDVALISGEDVVVRAGDFRGAWSEAHGAAELVVLSG